MLNESVRGQKDPLKSVKGQILKSKLKEYPQLKPYATKMTRSQRREIANDVFAYWLGGQERKSARDEESVVTLNEEHKLPCSIDSADEFFGEMPDAEEELLMQQQFGIVEAAERMVDARLKQAEAMQACAYCPLMDRCRMQSVVRKEEHGIWGGIASKDRMSIYRLTNKIIRSFNNNDMSEEALDEYRSRGAYNL